MIGTDLAAGNVPAQCEIPKRFFWEIKMLTAIFNGVCGFLGADIGVTRPDLNLVGEITGLVVGSVAGMTAANLVGSAVGAATGGPVGAVIGLAAGAATGVVVGTAVGTAVGVGMTDVSNGLAGRKIPSMALLLCPQSMALAGVGQAGFGPTISRAQAPATVINGQARRVT